MNRMEEYQRLLEAPVPQELEATLSRARKRLRRKNALLRSVSGLAACFALFVLLVNFSAPVAQACAQVPILRELAAAVTFSNSLTDAVENDYVQPLSLSQTDGDITASVEYLIVDQKQVNVFFRLDSEVYTELSAYPEVRTADGTHQKSCSYSLTSWDAENGELQSLCIDFVEGDVPPSLMLILNVRGQGSGIEAPSAGENANDYLFEDHSGEADYAARFEFLLEFDPNFTAAGKFYTVNQTVTLDGQQITITDLEVYPTHLRVNVADSAENTAWLKGLSFYIETDGGRKFEAVSSGITATGDTDSPSMISYWADSTYFYDAKHLELVITGAEWLRKDMEKTYVNLVAGETGPMPEGVEFISATRENSGWVLEFHAQSRQENHSHQLFTMTFYDAEGQEYEINSWSYRQGDAGENGNIPYFIETFPLKNYSFDEVWLCPYYSHTWTPEDPVEVVVQ